MLEQVAIAVLGVGAVALSQSKLASRRKWAPIVGLIGQPFWFYAAREQPGMLVVVTLYTVVWARGVWNQWLWQR